MLFISKADLIRHTPFLTLIDELGLAFCADYMVPMRHHHNYHNPPEDKDSTLLLMPAWEEGNYLGVKIVTVSPNNGKYDLPSIQGMYILFDARKGTPLAQLEAKTLTARRTAAASALASRFLSREDSHTLLMIGTGALAPNLIRAHATVRPIKKVIIWGRNPEKARRLKEELSDELFEIRIASSIEEEVAKADIISCATLSETPLIYGHYLKQGQHIDLVGSYLPHTREADDGVIEKSSVFVDTLEGACKESGDILIPLRNGLLKKEDIGGDLFALNKGLNRGRSTVKEITLFKSVGHALEDLTAAKLAYEAFCREEGGSKNRK